jgi:hypothetical protein
MDTERNWGAEEWRQPTEQAGDTVIFSECGRITHKTDFRSHWFKVVKQEYGPACLLVKHGGGEERLRLDYKADKLIALWSVFTSDERYMMLHMLYECMKDASRDAAMTASHKYELAFLEGRLKRRKRNNQYHCEIKQPDAKLTPARP